jgi:nicotinate-nucleotide adenylyltransferase
MRIGILGGTFNPIHNAHLLIAEAALERCRLDQILFLPASIPPHKEIAADVSFEHRLTMVELAIADIPAFAASDLEAKRPGASFSVDTLSQLQASQPEDDFYFIIGLDSFRDITTWKDYRQLFQLANIVVASRPGPGDDDPIRLLPVAIKDDFCYDGKSLKLRHKSGCELVFIHDTRFDISSTDIRNRVARGEPVNEHVSPPVIDYIEKHNLYRKNERPAT